MKHVAPFLRTKTTHNESKMKQIAVLGAIGMYSVLVLASRCSPVTHPTIAIPLIPNEAKAKPFRIQFIP
ncbi:MAG: hypothetical protein CNCCGFBP_02129 [Fimbriimonadaceae bacterium]|nr:hypothetical protein [Fimbriimonadaceae bacterium]